MAVWLINYKSFLSFKPLVPGVPFLPNPATIEFDLSKALYYLKIAVRGVEGNHFFNGGLW